MRDLVADSRFQLEKKIESELYKKFPDTFIPKYSMVTFLRIPYSVALERGRIQAEILHQLSEGIDSVEQFDIKKASELIKEHLHKL
jgi:kynurenine 3-monooxygenase